MQLFAFMGDQLLGRFTQTGEGHADFEYVPGYEGTPLSLSLPLDRPPSGDAAFSYLDNLLPEGDERRARLAAIHHTSPDVFSMLSVMGEDVAGAVSLSPNEELPDREPVIPALATDDDIAFRISQLRRDPTAPPPEWINTRWSLAGQQAKFSLARRDEQWYWSTFELPSTHIFKPAWERTRRAEQAELACLNLANQLNIPASRAEVVQFKQQSTLALIRWDRADLKRIHAEDMAQSLGLPPCTKYDVLPHEIIKILLPDKQEWAFVRQWLFNMAVGNSDAHAKNYSILLSGQSVELAPLYDTLPVFLWPEYDQDLAMLVGKKMRLSQVTESDWLILSVACGLDRSRMLDEVRSIFSVVAERLPDVLGGDGFDPGDKDLAASYVRENLAPHLS